jgi:ATP-dependent Clp protease ATP-binding subunit ClpA
VFDENVKEFNVKHMSEISAHREGNLEFKNLYKLFDQFIRPKLGVFFEGGLTRRIDAFVPFFKFSIGEAHVIADMKLDAFRENFAAAPTKDRHVGNLDLFVIDHAVGELIKTYPLPHLKGNRPFKGK